MQLIPLSRPHLFALFTATVWGLTFVSSKALLTTLTPFEIVLFRFCAAAIALFALRPRPFHHGGGWKLELHFAAAGFSGITLYYLLETMALTRSLASHVSVIVCLAPFFAGLFGYFFLKDTLSRSFLHGFAISLVGVAVIIANDALALDLDPIGDAIAIAAAMVWGVQGLVTRSLFCGGCPLLEATRRVILWGLVLLLPFLPFQERLPAVHLLADPATLAHVLGLGFVASAICYATWNYSLRALGVINTVIYVFMTPAITILAAPILLGEEITPFALFGMAVTLGGILYSERQHLLPTIKAERLRRQSYEFKQFGLHGKGFAVPDNIIVRTLKAFHLLSATAWAGGALSLQALGFYKFYSPDEIMCAHIAWCIHHVDTYVVMPGLAGCILTGLIYSMATSLGFVKYAWVAFKWFITLCAAFWGTFFWSGAGDKVIEAMGPCMMSCALENLRGCLIPEHMWQGAMQLTLILTMCLISVYRPRSFRLGAMRFPLRKTSGGKSILLLRTRKKKDGS